MDTNALLMAKVDLVEKGKSALEGVKDTDVMELVKKVIPDDWFTAWDDFKLKIFLWIGALVVLLILINLCSDAIQRAIRGLDLLIIGGLMVWLGIKVPDIIFIGELKMPLILLGGALGIVGILIFILRKTRGHRKKVKAAEKAKMEAMKEMEKQAAAETAAKEAKEAAEAKTETADKAE